MIVASEQHFQIPESQKNAIIYMDIDQSQVKEEKEYVLYLRALGFLYLSF